MSLPSSADNGNKISYDAWTIHDASVSDDVLDAAPVIDLPPDPPGAMAKEVQRRDMIPASGPTPGPIPDIQWSHPIPLTAEHEASPFPLDVFPDGLQRFASEGGKSIHCPVDYLAAPMPATAGGAIGNSRWIRIKNGHEQPAAIYQTTVARPGAAKSPAQSMVTAPLEKCQWLLRKQWEMEVEALVEANGEKAKSPPPMKRIHCGDTTTETCTAVFTWPLSCHCGLKPKELWLDI